MKIVRKKIDLHVSILIMEFDGNIVNFEILNPMSSPTFDPSLCDINAFDFMV